MRKVVHINQHDSKNGSAQSLLLVPVVTNDSEVIPYARKLGSNTQSQIGLQNFLQCAPQVLSKCPADMFSWPLNKAPRPHSARYSHGFEPVEMLFLTFILYDLWPLHRNFEYL